MRNTNIELFICLLSFENDLKYIQDFMGRDQLRGFYDHRSDSGAICELNKKGELFL
jgi:hypothetical protein